MKTAMVSKIARHNDDEYQEFLASIQNHFAAMVEKHGKNLFTTNATGLFDTFLAWLPAEVRRHYTCNSCRRFVDTYGGLVTITPDGITLPVMWPDDVPELYMVSVANCWQMVSDAKVTGVFLETKPVWGLPVTGEWHHMAVSANGVTFKPTLLTASQVMAEKHEDYKTLIAGLVEYPLSAVEQAITLLKTDSLYRSEKCLGVAEWLAELHRQRAAIKNNVIKSNITWLAVATAPAGYCHVKSTMIGTLLDDIVSGMSFDAISRRFADKTHPLQYQRPQVAPTAGNIAQAEKVIEQLKAAGSLARRFARLDEIKTLWRSVEQVKPVGDGVFYHLQPKGRTRAAAISVPLKTVTWAKFKQTVLPDALKIEFYVPHQRIPYTAMVTAADFDAPPILQWDFEDERNPVSWYLYHGGSMPGQWNLMPGWSKVTGVCLSPVVWGSKPMPHQGEGAFFIIDGCKDAGNGGTGLFPEILKSEFHGIRATIEAYSRNDTLSGRDEASACGIMLQKGGTYNYKFRVITGNAVMEYTIDRWD